MMFKLHFVNLVNITSHEINLNLDIQGKPYPKLNQLTIQLYHHLFTRRR